MRYVGITGPDINNGTGCRVTLWISGCSHRCKGCHNPELWHYDVGSLLPTHENDNFKAIIEKLDKPYIKGLTLSGGDPLCQNSDGLDELGMFITLIKEHLPEKDIWIYTGYRFEELSKQKLEILKQCDVLVDGKYIEEERDITLPFRGSRNQRIIDLRKTFKNKNKVVLKEV